MSLIKKIIFSVFIIVSVALGVLGYNALKQNKKPAKDVLAMMPDSCAFFCSTKNFSDLNVKLNSQNLIFKSWTVFKQVKVVKDDLRFFDSLIYSNDLIREITEDNSIYFAIYNSVKSISWLAAFNLKEQKQEKEIIEFCRSNLKERSLGLFLINGDKILAIKEGVLLISNSDELIQKSFGKGNKLISNTAFLEQIKDVGQSDEMRIYVNHALYNKSALYSEFKINELLDAKQTAAMVKFSPTEIILNGNYKPSDHLIQQIINTQEPLTISIYDQLPFVTSSFRAIAISSPSEFQRSLSSDELTKKAWKAINKKALYNAVNEFYNCIDNSIVEFNAFNNRSLGINLNDTIKCMELLNLMGAVDTIYNNTKIFHLSKVDINKDFFSKMFDVKAKYAFTLNSVLYLTESKTPAQEIIYAILNNATLNNNVVFMNYANENINTFCNYVHYLIPSKCIKSIDEFTSFDIENNKLTIENLSDANVVTAKQKGILKFRMHLNYQAPSSGGIPNQLWQCRLDSDIISKPFLFVNHNTHENEIVVQDKLNQLYLINSTGGIIWKKKINEAVRSEIYTVDLFRNKKNQLLFNTDNYLHLIDRNGKYVQGYPVKLPAKASSPLSLIDYDGDKDFRIFIACKNNTIYNFNLYGVRTEGYRPFKTDALVKLPVKFVRVGESDYLITIDESGVIQSFSRKGDARIGLRNKAIENCQDFAIVATNNINRTFLYYIDDKNNLINRISFADKKDVIKLNHNLMDASIKFQTVNEDQTPDFISQSSNGIIAADINGSILYENDKLSATGIARNNKYNMKQVYYVYDKDKQMIYMTNNRSTQVLEIRSNSSPNVFNLFKDEKKYMVYSYNGRLMCNLLK